MISIIGGQTEATIQNIHRTLIGDAPKLRENTMVRYVLAQSIAFRYIMSGGGLGIGVGGHVRANRQRRKKTY